MGMFNFFKKKDSFEDILKDPLSEPLGRLPGASDGVDSQNSMSMSQDLPPFDMPGMPKDDSFPGMQDNTFNNQVSTAAPIPQAQYNYGTQNNYTGQNSSSRRISPKNLSYESEVMDSSNTNHKQETSSKETLDRRDVELINSKLDNIKSQLETIGQRLVTLERQSHEEQTPQRNKRYNW